MCDRFRSGRQIDVNTSKPQHLLAALAVLAGSSYCDYGYIKWRCWMDIRHRCILRVYSVLDLSAVLLNSYVCCTYVCDTVVPPSPTGGY